ncbi:MAG: hypothetical protein H7Z14_15355 [Anaerolineae bacterium]|nr:hypothetical protein [Phycisphaerae bacterium]
MAMDCLISNLLAQLPGASNRMDTGTWIALIIAVGATAYIYYRARRGTKKDPLENRPMSSSMAQHRAVERQMSNLLVELSEMARTVSASLDTRAAKLEALMDQADQRIEALRALNSSDPAPRSLPSKQIVSVRDDELNVHIPPPRADDRHVEVYALSDQGRTVPQIAAELGRPSGEIELILALRPRETTVVTTGAT